MRPSTVVLALTFAFVFSGCLEATGSDSANPGARRVGAGGSDAKEGFAANWPEVVFSVGQDHNHHDMTQHQGLGTPNFKVLGHNELSTDYHGGPAGGYFCGDTVGSADRVLSVVHSWVSDVAFVISDVTDPANPEKIGELVMGRTHVYDLAMSPDQQWVFLATSATGQTMEGEQLPVSPPLEDRGMFFRDACTGEERPVLGPEQGLPFASGIVLVDISNPRVPAIADFRFFPPGGGHSVQVQDVDGETMILISQSTPPTYYAFANLLDTPAGKKMNVLSVYAYPGTPTPVPGVSVPLSLHDAYMHVHPVTGEHLAYLAYGGASLVVVNIDDPTQPEFVAQWKDWSVFGEAAPASPFVHEALPIEGLWDGRHYTFIGEECGARRPSSPTCLVALLDTTDPSNPTFVGGWTLPVDIEWSGGLMYSLHYLALSGRTLFATNYHGGLWAIDVSTPETMRTMPSIGVFMPDVITDKPVAVPHQYEYAPVVLDANAMPDGNLVVYDGTSGLYVVDFDETNPAPAPAPWPFPFNQ